MGADIPQAPGWFSYTLAVILGLLSTLLGIYRSKVDEMEKNQGTFAKTAKVDELEKRQQLLADIQNRFPTRDELRQDLSARFEDMDVRRLQMHNHNVETMRMVNTSIEGLRADLREDLAQVHRRIDELK
jgi:hypothetical protein